MKRHQEERLSRLVKTQTGFGDLVAPFHQHVTSLPHFLTCQSRTSPASSTSTIHLPRMDSKTVLDTNSPSLFRELKSYQAWRHQCVDLDAYALFENETLADFKVRVAGHTFNVNRFQLTARSKYFANMLKVHTQVCFPLTYTTRRGLTYLYRPRKAKTARSP